MSERARTPGRPELAVVASDYADGGSDLLRRWGQVQAFWDARLASAQDPTSRIVLGPCGTEASVLTRTQEELRGVNFASQDHLSLNGHPALREAAIAALAEHGLHAGGPAAMQGGSRALQMLEERLADLLCCRDAVACPSAWLAGYGAVRALVTERDHVLVDCLATPALREAAAATTRKLHLLPHADAGAAVQRLARLRAQDARSGILLVTETVFALDSAVPDLRALRDACRVHGATLLVHATHDLFAGGDGGLGVLGRAGLIGEVDVVVGNFAAALGSDGGFVASNAPGLRQALLQAPSPLAGCPAVSPVQAASLLAALDILRSAEGAIRRRRLAANVHQLREGLAARAFQLSGEASAVVPVVLGALAEARLMTRAALAEGALVNLVEHPAVSRGASRWPLLVMADHTPSQIARMVAIAVEAREQALAADPVLFGRTHG